MPTESTVDAVSSVVYDQSNTGYAVAHTLELSKCHRVVFDIVDSARTTEGVNERPGKNVLCVGAARLVLVEGRLTLPRKRSAIWMKSLPFDSTA